MQLTRSKIGATISPAGAALATLLVCVAVLVVADPAFAKSSLGIGTAEVTSQPSGPFAGLFVEINRYQREFFTALRKALVGMKNGSGGTLFLVGLSFVYGVFHAAGPGHGKAVISSYVLANEVQLRRGILLSFVSALFQAGTAIVVVGLGWFVLRGTKVSMTDATNWLEIASFAMIAAFGGWLLVKKLVRLATRPKRSLALDFAPSSGAVPAGGGASVLGFSGPTVTASAPAMRFGGAPGRGLGGAATSRAAIMQPASAGLAADVCVADADDCGCGRAHMPDPKALGGKHLSFGSAASAVVAVGLRPCSGAIVVLTFGLLNGLYLGGILSVLAMALGTAITVSAIAILAVFAKDVALRFGSAGGSRRMVLDGVEVLGAALVMALGLLLLGGALA